MVLIVLSLVLFLLPEIGGPQDRLYDYLEDLAHFPVFAVVCILFRLLLPQRKGVSVLVVLLALLVGLAIEWAQPLIGRTTSMRDVVLGVAGSIAGVSLFNCATARSPRAKLTMAGLVLLLALAAVVPLAVLAGDAWLARRQFPQLGGFEWRTELGRWYSNGCDLSRDSSHATEGRYALQITVTNSSQYPGAFLLEGPRDWRGLRELCGDFFLSGTEDRSVWMRVDDKTSPKYEDRVQSSVLLKPGRNHICWDRNQMVTTPGGRRLDLEHILKFGVFFDKADVGDVLYVDDLTVATNETRSGIGGQL